ncbi:hypothetical protein K9L97_02710 [Candidatus Woesearchaeota archaeon]|nr:hypothetical protein [Candidatus Woesearchaeota archaeon]
MKDKYVKLVEKYGLPSYEDLLKNFDIDLIDDEDNVLKEIMKKMLSRFDYFSDQFETLLQPDSALSTMHEASFLSVVDRKKIKHLFAKLRFLSREISIEFLNYDESKFANKINYLFAQWQVLKVDIELIFEKLRDTWTKESEIKEDRGYFG